jgi:putative addiction module component (TIGR02574 family)
MARPAIEIDKLGVDERLDLIEEIWESLVSDPRQVPLPDAHKAVLDKRLDQIEAGDDRGIPWEEVLNRIRNRLK